MRVLRWLMARLDGPWAGRVVILIALALALPSLLSPPVLDEYAQAIKWRASGEQAGRGFLSDCFVFAHPSTNRREMEHGLGAWWVAPDLKIAFWRPLAATTHAIDLLLWPRSAVAMHLHSLLWFVGLLLALGALYRRFLP